MSTILYLDCASGISGDMVLGALIDLGVPVDELRAALGTLVPAGTELRTARVLRSGISALSFTVVEPDPGTPGHTHGAGHDHHHGHAHDHGHHHDAPHEHADGHTHAHAHHHDHAQDHRPASTSGRHHHRPLADIFAAIEGSALPPAVKARALTLYERIGRVEADIHQVPFERVHLHEVGAIDSVVDIVGAAYAFHWLGVDRIVSSPLNVGGGRVRTDHGLLPVPAPATLRLLEGTPVFSDGTMHELVTPTGALLASSYVSEWGTMPAMTVARVGYGAGGRDLPGHPNVVRAILGDSAGHTVGDDVVVVETNIDDMNPQLFGPLMDSLLDAGALDVFYTPVQMKKNRPGTLVTVIAPPARRDTMASLLLRGTTTIGVRTYPASRTCLAREMVAVSTTFGDVRAKVVRGEAFAKAQPEFDDCVRLAHAAGVSVRETYGAALQACASLNLNPAVPSAPAEEHPRD